MTARGTDSDSDLDSADVVVVGGGPSGCAAAVFTARYGLDTVVFDRGNAALRRCAYLENYLGFPAGIGVDTFTALVHEHLAEVGADYVADMVVSVERPGDESEVTDASEAESDADDADAPRFVVRTQEGRRVEADHVVAAAWYDGDYLRGLDDDDAMFEEHDHHGEVHEHFDSDYADDDGRTPVEGLYVAAPSGARNAQVGIAAGQGGHVARCLIEDRRRERGFPGDLARHYDWLRADTEFQGEWGDRDRWREWFDGEVPDDADLDDERLAELRESYIDRAFDTRRTDREVEAAESRGIRRLVETIGTERVLDALPDEALADYLDGRELGGVEQ
ncbi:MULTISPECIES: FAD-dependent oxidoreductase [Haloferax]|uniref:Thioredoxin reductase n=1 Tax=Haloferax massiliensis TaxID=1476858 RepID=A0A0D6JNA0_9EURY|nr:MULTISPECIES: FAD-dependent oxidoreductase [Haloferax]MDS0243849.1 FAD-dependent oxidoreductase [Haloferax sp. S2CR25]MDS0446970.1 FAD-dependent oxidoreductase [Haloferax sp. S2CR25-2]CQR49080.1 Thioredoxin reductase [Haloferax massiliensis]